MRRLSVHMERALLSGIAEHLGTARALLSRQMISHFKALPTTRARYAIVRTELGKRWKRWFKRLQAKR